MWNLPVHQSFTLGSLGDHLASSLPLALPLLSFPLCGLRDECREPPDNYTSASGCVSWTWFAGLLIYLVCVTAWGNLPTITNHLDQKNGQSNTVTGQEYRGSPWVNSRLLNFAALGVKLEERMYFALRGPSTNLNTQPQWWATFVDTRIGVLCRDRIF